MIGFALDAGSSAAGRVFSPLVFELNRLLEQGCSREYFTPSIDIVLSLRVSGEIADFGFDGCDRLRKNQKKKLLTHGYRGTICSLEERVRMPTQKSAG